MASRPAKAMPALSRSLVAASILFAACSGTGDEGEGGTATGAGDGNGGTVSEIAESDDAGVVAETTGGDEDISTDADDAGTSEADCVGADCGDASDDDGDTSDAGTQDTGEPPIDCPGGAGCDCQKNDDCDNAYCIDTPAGKKCAKTCVNDCPKGFTCKAPGSSDTVFICMPDHLVLCAPCVTDTECKYQGSDAICISYGDIGSFCGSGCNVDSDCPDKFACIETKDSTTGKLTKQCKLKPAADGSPSLCECSKWATAVGAKTPCKTTNASGTCGGYRGCGDSGMTACDAPQAQTETCDSIDNDCDGATDNPSKSQTCSKKAWFDAGTKASCKADADCTSDGESCDPVSSTCRIVIGECMGTPTCEVGGKLVCKDVKTPKAEMCNGEDDDCDAQVDEDFDWENPDDGSKVAIGGACGLGICKGGSVKCDTLASAVCDSEKQKSTEVCDGDDNDCNGKTDEKTCDDGSSCTDDVCDGAKAACSNPSVSNCDDKNVCTKDSCNAKTGKCVFAFSEGSCDDGNACTNGDACKQDAGGKAACLPGAATQSCDDDNVCTDDSCSPDKGCVSLPNATAVVCYSAIDKDTAGKGACKKGTQYCKKGKLQFECVGQVLPKLSESCDGTDDDCDGKTDEGCKSARIDASFANAWGTVNGKKVNLTVELGGSSAAGTAAGKKKTAEFGFLQWVLNLLSKK